MKRFFLQIVLMPGMLALLSCGTSKKLEQANNQVNQLTTELNQLRNINSEQQQQLTSYEADIAKLKTENAQFLKEAQDCREVKDAITQNLKSINNALAEQGTSLRQMRAKADTAMLKFGNAGIDVFYKNGLLHIAIEDYLMFTSGSTAVGWEGKQALAVVADVVKDFPGVGIYVIGNTDDVPVTSGNKDNWTISTERANSVVRVLVNEFNVTPDRVISGGRSKFHPIADNATADGRARNRRIDIILNPNLERLWEMAGRSK